MLKSIVKSELKKYNINIFKIYLEYLDDTSLKDIINMIINDYEIATKQHIKNSLGFSREAIACLIAELIDEEAHNSFELLTNYFLNK